MRGVSRGHPHGSAAQGGCACPVDRLGAAAQVHTAVSMPRLKVLGHRSPCGKHHLTVQSGTAHSGPNGVRLQCRAEPLLWPSRPRLTTPGRRAKVRSSSPAIPTCAVIWRPSTTSTHSWTGPHCLDLAMELGLLPSPTNTIIPFARAASIGARTDGSMPGTSREVLSVSTVMQFPRPAPSSPIVRAVRMSGEESGRPGVKYLVQGGPRRAPSVAVAEQLRDPPWGRP